MQNLESNLSNFSSIEHWQLRTNVFSSAVIRINFLLYDFTSVSLEVGNNM